MREFLSYVLESFRDATGWSRDNGYSDFNVAANELLNFPTPRGLRMSLSSLATPHFATSYNLGSVGVVDGAISYLYSSVPLLPHVVAQSSRVPLPTLLRSYRQRPRPSGQPPFLDAAFSTTARTPLTLDDLFPFRTAAAAATAATATTAPETATTTATTSPPTPPPTPPAANVASTLLLPAADQLAAALHEARALVDKPALLYGRLYLPRSMLEAYMVKRLAPSVQLQLRAVSDAKLPGGGTVLGVVQLDRGRYGLEGLVSSDGGLLGVRGLYNFGDTPSSSASTTTVTAGDDPSSSPSTSTSTSPPRLHGRFSAGGEIYYGTLNKSGGMSFGARFETAVLGDNKNGDRREDKKDDKREDKKAASRAAGTPLTATLTINPLMGNLSAAYAVVAREDCSLATRFDFNVYSYESEWSVGMELWSTRRLAGLVAMDAEREAGRDARDGAVDWNGSWNGSGGKAPAVPITPPPIAASSSPSSFGIPERSFQAKLEWRLDDPVPPPDTVALSTVPSNPNDPFVAAADNTPTDEVPAKTGEEKYQGVLKARLDQNLKIGLLWEGRIKSLLFSLGSAVDLHRLDQPFRTLGLEIQFSS